MDHTTSVLPFIDEQGLASRHPALFHYTKLENFERIIKTGGLLATPYDATNDSSELRAAENILRPALVNKAKSEIIADYASGRLIIEAPLIEIVKTLESDFEIFYKSLIEAMPFAPRIACFSANTKENHHKNGILTMWRLYAGSTARIAIGFDTERMINLSEEFVEKTGCSYCYLDAVSYSLECEQLLSRLSSKGVNELYYQTVITMINDRLAESVPGNRERLMEFFVLNNSVKHPDFEDEREVRLILADVEAGPKAESSKYRGRVLFPCLSAINQIIIGPNPNQKVVAARVEEIIGKELQRDIPILISETPFRDI